jgi:hypothetical protein
MAVVDRILFVFAREFTQEQIDALIKNGVITNRDFGHDMHPLAGRPATARSSRPGGV